MAILTGGTARSRDEPSGRAFHKAGARGEVRTCRAPRRRQKGEGRPARLHFGAACVGARENLHGECLVSVRSEGRRGRGAESAAGRRHGEAALSRRPQAGDVFQRECRLGAPCRDLHRVRAGDADPPLALGRSRLDRWRDGGGGDCPHGDLRRSRRGLSRDVGRIQPPPLRNADQRPS